MFKWSEPSKIFSNGIYLLKVVLKLFSNIFKLFLKFKWFQILKFKWFQMFFWMVSLSHRSRRYVVRAYQNLLARIRCQQNSDSHKGSPDRRYKGSSDKRHVSRFLKGKWLFRRVIEHSLGNRGRFSNRTWYVIHEKWKIQKKDKLPEISYLIQFIHEKMDKPQNVHNLYTSSI